MHEKHPFCIVIELGPTLKAVINTPVLCPGGKF